MRIVIVANSSWYIANFRLRLMSALAKAGHEVLAISPVDEHVGRIAEAGFTHCALPLSAGSVNPLREIRSILSLRSLLRLRGVELALTYTPKGNLYTGIACRGLPCRQIANVSGLGSSFLRQDWVSAVAKWLYRQTLPRAEWTFFQNPSDRQHFLAAGLVKPDRAVLVPGSGVDLQRFSHMPLPRETAGFVFLMVARLIADKGVREFVEAARRVRRTSPSARFQLLGALGADNPTAIAPQELQAWVSAGDVEYLGFTDDVRDALSQASCVVLPSYREGMARTLLEAAAMGRPLITTNVPGCADVVDEGLNGHLCNARDVDTLERAMLRMLSHSRDEREQMGLRSRQKVEQSFSEDIVIDRYMQAVARLASGR